MLIESCPCCDSTRESRILTGVVFSRPTVTAAL
jgi:hypothetical protein